MQNQNPEGNPNPEWAETDPAAPVVDDTIKLVDGTNQLKSKNYLNAIGIAGLATSGKLMGGRYSPEDVLNATAKMYAGVKVTLPSSDPTDWVYRITDSKKKTVDTHRTLEQVAVSEKPRARDMYEAIVGLAEGNTTNKTQADKILGKISLGATLAGTKFQLLFHFNTDSVDGKISGDGMIRYNDAKSFKKFVVEKNTIISSAMEGKKVLDLMNSLLGQDLKLAADAAGGPVLNAGADEAARVAAVKAEEDRVAAVKAARVAVVPVSNNPFDDPADAAGGPVLNAAALPTPANEAAARLAAREGVAGDGGREADAAERQLESRRLGLGGKSTRRKRKNSRKKGSSKKPVSHKKRKSGASKKGRSLPKKK